MLQLLHLWLLFFLPGAIILLGSKARLQRASTGILASISISIFLVQLISLALLRFGEFRIRYIWGALFLCLIPFLTRRKSPLKSLRRVRLDKRELLVMAAAATAISAFHLATPHWNFLTAYGMDSGNYELFSNDYMRTGELYRDNSELVRLEIPTKWFRVMGSWYFDPDSRAVPAFLYGYPVLLGVTKKVFSSQASSWIFNAALGAATAAALSLLAVRASGSGLFALLLFLAAAISPLYLIYTKQLMSEQLALFGMTAFVLGLIEDLRSRDSVPILLAASGMGIMLLTKIDFVYPPVLFLIGTLLIEGKGRCGTNWRKRRRYFSLAAVIALAVGVDVILCAHPYLDHFSVKHLLGFEILQNHPRRRLALFGSGVAAGFALLGFLSTATGERLFSLLPPPRIRSWGLTVFAAIWAFFLLWNATWRPLSADSIATQHDAYNLWRLFDVISPPLFAAFLVLSGYVLILVGGMPRAIIFALLVQLMLLIYKSLHSAPEIWWMRRYFPLVMPAIILVIGIAYRTSISRQQTNYRRAITWAFSILLIFQLYWVRPLFSLQLNSEVPGELARIRGILPEKASVIQIQSSYILFGIARTLSSMHQGLMLFQVGIPELGEAINKLQSRIPIYILSQEPIESDIRANLSLQEVSRGTVSRQLPLKFTEAMDSPTGNSAKVDYFLYQAAPS